MIKNYFFGATYLKFVVALETLKGVDTHWRINISMKNEWTATRIFSPLALIVFSKLWKNVIVRVGIHFTFYVREINKIRNLSGTNSNFIKGVVFNFIK